MQKNIKNKVEQEADICIVGEGSYPYYAGGVAQWVHELITEHQERTFHVITLLPPNPPLDMHYKFPKNVIGHSVIIVQQLPKGSFASKAPKETWDILANTLIGLVNSPEFEDFGPIVDFFQKHRDLLGKRILCESTNIWDLYLKVYEEFSQSTPFKSYFATVYTLSRSFYSILLPKLPKAKLYHALCTGYAGFLLYRAKRELKVPCIVTEQGIYSNERRIEISMAAWIVVMGCLDLALEDKKKSLKDFWLNAFFSLAHACYISCDEVISTFDGNNAIQIEGGADPGKISNIVHGIDPSAYEEIRQKRTFKQKNVAFVGRIVPIKDVKTFIRACKIVKEKLPWVNLIAAGPFDEDLDYYEECQKLTVELGMTEHLKFTGHINFKEFLYDMDLLVLTSLSEAQPLVILEAGAAGIPAIATNVGACKQLLYGASYEDPPLGQAGFVTPIGNPEATAEAIIAMMSDPELYRKCSETIAKRVQTYYVFKQEHERYRAMYKKYIDK